jgi:hypothetical protein
MGIEDGDKNVFLVGVTDRYDGCVTGTTDGNDGDTTGICDRKAVGPIDGDADRSAGFLDGYDNGFPDGNNLCTIGLSDVNDGYIIGCIDTDVGDAVSPTDGEDQYDVGTTDGNVDG